MRQKGYMTLREVAQVIGWADDLGGLRRTLRTCKRVESVLCRGVGAGIYMYRVK